MCVRGVMSLCACGEHTFYQPETTLLRARQVITSYDYGSPLSESGHTGQPGLGGPNGFEVRA